MLVHVGLMVLGGRVLVRVGLMVHWMVFLVHH